MSSHRRPAAWHVAALGAALLLSATNGHSQEVRVRLIIPEVRTSVPADGLRAFRKAVLDTSADVVIVGSLRQATDLIELSEYKWEPNDERGVRESWRFSYRPLHDPVAIHAASATPVDVRIIASGDTAEACARTSALMLRDRLQPLLKHVPRTVPK
jgi:hypothetical protein